MALTTDAPVPDEVVQEIVGDGRLRRRPRRGRLGGGPGIESPGMRAVVITRHGGPEVLEVQELPDPKVGPGDVRVAVRASGINFADTLARAGTYPDAPRPPCVVGYEVAGEVESVGEGVEGFEPATASSRARASTATPSSSRSPRTRSIRCRRTSASSRAPRSRSTTRPPTRRS